MSTVVPDCDEKLDASLQGHSRRSQPTTDIIRDDLGNDEGDLSFSAQPFSLGEAEFPSRTPKKGRKAVTFSLSSQVSAKRNTKDIVVYIPVSKKHCSSRIICLFLFKL